MKWIRRKPNWKMHGRVAFSCFIFLTIAPFVVNVIILDHTSGLLLWILGARPRGVITAPNGEAVYYNALEKDGALTVLTSKDPGYQALASDPDCFELSYHAGTYRVGFWAPTHELDAKLLVHPEQIWGTGGGPSKAPPMERILEVQAALVAYEGLDPRLATEQHVVDPTIIWYGFVINAAFLVAVCGLAWSIAWVPARVRDQRRQTRAESGLCPMCAYDVRATPAQCPECGWGVVPTA